jgi:hypothetical protein
VRREYPIIQQIAAFRYTFGEKPTIPNLDRVILGITGEKQTGLI